jgi:hypothetical protein
MDEPLRDPTPAGGGREADLDRAELAGEAIEFWNEAGLEAFRAGRAARSLSGTAAQRARALCASPSHCYCGFPLQTAE